MTIVEILVDNAIIFVRANKCWEAIDDPYLGIELLRLHLGGTAEFSAQHNLEDSTLLLTKQLFLR